MLLVEHGGGTIAAGRTDAGGAPGVAPVRMALDLPDRVAGVAYAPGATVRRLTQVGCTVELVAGEDGRGQVVATPPSWRPDLVEPADLVEEVLRLEGYEAIPSRLPTAPAGRGLTPAQRRRRKVSVALAEAGYVEVLPFPFVGPHTWDAFGLAADDPRRHTVTVRNPLDADRGELATTLLPGLIDTLVRNRSRGAGDLALFTVGQVVLPHREQLPMPEPGVAGRPSDAEIAQIAAALPAQPLHVGVVLAGDREPRGWWGGGRPAAWADAVEAARLVGQAAGVELRVTAGDNPPWHPGRCAMLRVGDFPVGFAGELHPKVVDALGLPPRTCAMELDLDLAAARRRPARPRACRPTRRWPSTWRWSPRRRCPRRGWPTPCSTAAATSWRRCGSSTSTPGSSWAPGKRSLAYTLRFRAPDRTLTSEEANTARDAAVAVAAQRHGARLR